MLAELKVSHCPSCGKIFQKNLRNMCGDCASVSDKQFDAIDRYLLRYPKATTDELSNVTSVPKKIIHQFIRSKKISLSAFPNVTDACDLCGGDTRTGHLCMKCSTKIKGDIQDMFAKDAELKERHRNAASYKFKQ